MERPSNMKASKFVPHAAALAVLAAVTGVALGVSPPKVDPSPAVTDRIRCPPPDAILSILHDSRIPGPEC
jgi:hypothetical protein